MERLTGLVLLVDDERETVEYYGELLHLLGYEVRITTRPPEVIGWIRLGIHPDLIITDHSMEPMNGFELASELRREGFAGPILMVSGGNFEHTPREITRHLTKPVDWDLLETVVAELVGPHDSLHASA